MSEYAYQAECEMWDAIVASDVARPTDPAIAQLDQLDALELDDVDAVHCVQLA